MKYLKSRRSGIGFTEGVDIVARPGCRIGIGHLPIETESVARLTPSLAPGYGLARVDRDTPQQLEDPKKNAVPRVAVAAKMAEVASCDGWSELEVIR